MSRLVSRPGIDAYAGFSLNAPHVSGGLFQPGTAVEFLFTVGAVYPGAGAACAGAACVVPETPPSGFGGVGAALVGAVTGPLAGVPAGACADAASGSARANPAMSAPRRRARAWSMSPPVVMVWRRRAWARNRSGTGRDRPAPSRTPPCRP